MIAFDFRGIIPKGKKQLVQHCKNGKNFMDDSVVADEIFPRLMLN